MASISHLTREAIRLFDCPRCGSKKGDHCDPEEQKKKDMEDFVKSSPELREASIEMLKISSQLHRRRPYRICNERQSLASLSIRFPGSLDISCDSCGAKPQELCKMLDWGQGEEVQYLDRFHKSRLP